MHTQKVDNEVSPEVVESTLKTIAETKEIIGRLIVKYQLKPHVIQLSKTLNTTKASNWVDLLETSTKSLSRYGSFSDENSSIALENDMTALLALTEKLIEKKIQCDRNREGRVTDILLSHSCDSGCISRVGG